MTESNRGRTRAGVIDRRNLLGVAAWSAPVIAFAVAAPATAASKVEYQAFSGSHIRLVTEDIERNGVVVATPTFALRGEADNPIVYFGTNTSGLTATITNYVATYKLPFAVDWDEIDPNWNVSESAPVDGYYTYTITPKALPGDPLRMELPLSTGRPDTANSTNSMAAPQFHGIARPGTWTLGGPRSFDVYSVKHYDFIAQLPSGDVTDSFHRERLTGGV
ncbi:hypothetical protein [Pseudoclavibacter helvolus]|uniref:hypothetical protein n=1 Tax=Pseudoclavibacter helvolus TaxID=255205 RepID=UPI003C715E6E